MLGKSSCRPMMSYLSDCWRIRGPIPRTSLRCRSLTKIFGLVESGDVDRICALMSCSACSLSPDEVLTPHEYRIELGPPLTRPA
jgi:hypothetical protein